MKILRVRALVRLVATGVVVATNAEATIGPPYPDNETACSTNGPCLDFENTNSGSQAVTIFAKNTAGGVATIEGIGPPVSASSGVYGLGSATSSYGVYGSNSGASSYGVYGYGNGSSATGVYGYSPGYNGVHGRSNSATNAGVWGVNGATGGGGRGVSGTITPAGVGYAVYGENSSTTSGSWAVFAHGNFQVTGTPYCLGCTVFTNNSDIRLKTHVEPLEHALDTIVRLHGVTFEWIKPEEHGNRAGTQRGFIAQEVEKVIPDWVGTDEKGFKTLNTTGLDALLVESVRTLKSENDALRDRVRALEEKRPLASGFIGNGLLGLGLMALGGAIVVARRREQRAPRPSASSERPAAAAL